MARVRSSSDGSETRLDRGWELARAEPGRATEPSALASLGLDWQPAEVPGTVASSLRRNGRPAEESRSLDAFDHVFRCRFARGDAPAKSFLRLRGLATIAEVWLNGASILSSENMFHEHLVDATGMLADDNELVLRFASLKTWLEKRRPRPRWKTRLVDQQQLRFARTTLLGRIPGWSPPLAPVGPWREIALENRTIAHIERSNVRARLDGDAGLVEASILARTLRGEVDRAELEVAGERRSLTVTRGGDLTRLEGSVRLEDVPRWWPHTHGAQPLFDVRLHLVVAGEPVLVDYGKTGFRAIEVDQTGGGFCFRVNGERVFSRGTCWTTSDLATLVVGEPETRKALELARDAGVNMLRVGGTMFYEDDAFYASCDELGILVWQDFMFANMDYPFADEAFVASVRREADELLSRTQLSPSLALFCGNSEGEQQAAMLGLERDQWSSPLFRDVLPSAVAAHRPDVPYWPSSASGGALPFHPDTGTTSYYGVGAYLRELEDARRSGLRFASEALAFANVPGDETIEAVLADGQSPVHHPKWKERVPRDSGPGWDFEDVRDHYVQRLFGVDPMRLRYADMDRYLAMSRAAVGHAMESAFAEWRRSGSVCDGALVWFHRDLWPGAGWGIMDWSGGPKASYFHLKRAWKPITVIVTDEGLNGLALHAINESPSPLRVELMLTLYRHGETEIARGARELELAPRSTVAVHGDALLGRFVDSTYAYRFGPAGHDVAHATMRELASNEPVGEAFHFPLGLGSFPTSELGLEANALPRQDGSYELLVRTKKLAQFVAIDARGFLPSDDRFHLAPGGERTLTLRPRKPGARFSAFVHALNDRAPVRVTTSPGHERGAAGGT